MPSENAGIQLVVANPSNDVENVAGPSHDSCFVCCVLITSVILANPFGFIAGMLVKCSRCLTRVMLIFALLWGFVQTMLCIGLAITFEQAAESDGTGYVLFVPAFLSLVFCRVWVWFYKQI